MGNDGGVEELKSKGKHKKKVNGGNSGKGKTILVIVLLLFVGYMWKESYSNGIGLGALSNMVKGYNSTPEENLNVFLGGVKDLDKINREGFEGTHPVYDKKNIYEDDKALQMPGKEYALYVYTGDESLDSRFNEWAMREDDKFLIYKLDRSNLYMNEALIEHTTSDRVPLVYVIKEVGKNYKLVDKVVSDPDKLDDVSYHLEKLEYERKEGKSKK